MGGEKLFKVSVLQGAPSTTNKKTKKIHIEGATHSFIERCMAWTKNSAYCSE